MRCFVLELWLGGAVLRCSLAVAASARSLLCFAALGACLPGVSCVCGLSLDAVGTAWWCVWSCVVPVPPCLSCCWWVLPVAWAVWGLVLPGPAFWVLLWGCWSWLGALFVVFLFQGVVVGFCGWPAWWAVVGVGGSWSSSPLCCWALAARVRTAPWWAPSSCCSLSCSGAGFAFCSCAWLLPLGLLCVLLPLGLWPPPLLFAGACGAPALGVPA